MMKSLSTDVFWPAWEWGPKNLPSMRYVATSYSQNLTVRDNERFRQIITADLYREFWGERFVLSSDSKEKVQNDRTGWKLATSVGGVGTGERGDRVIIDDPNNVKETESDRVRDSTNQWFNEVMPTRLNNPNKSAIVVIQQRTHEEDVSGIIMAKELDYDLLMIPMEFESSRTYSTSIGWVDPRSLDDDCEPLEGQALDEADGLLAWPERYPPKVVAELQSQMGPYAYAGQMQQRPEPRGGGIFKRDWWQDWPPPGWPNLEHARRFWPPMEYVVASLDTAFTEKEENDYCALTIWGIFRAMGRSRVLPTIAMDVHGDVRLEDNKHPKIVLQYGWQKRLELHGPPESEDLKFATHYCSSCKALAGTIHHPRCQKYNDMRRDSWGCVEWTVDSCRRYRVDTLLVEAKASGHDVANELARLYSKEDWGVQLVDPKGDKVARAYSVQHLFSNGVVYAPMLDSATGQRPAWCETILTQMQHFPKSRYKDLVDSSVHALRHLRDVGFALRTEEADEDFVEEMRYHPTPGALYET